MGYPFDSAGAINAAGSLSSGSTGLLPAIFGTGAAEARSADPTASLTGSPQDNFLQDLESELGGGGLGLNLGSLLGQDNAAQQAQQQNGMTPEVEQQLIQLLEQIQQLMAQMQQQIAQGDQQGASDSQNQISGLQDQMTNLMGGGGSPSSSGGAAPAAGGGSSGGYAGGPSSSGGGGGATDTSASGGAPGAGAVNVDPSKMGEGTDWGKSLAAEAFSHAGPASQGLCYKFVGEDLRKFGVQTSGEGAYMAADQLAKSDKFQEAKGLANNDLKKLPAGAVVVWNKGNGHQWGHISIADGHGNEASDFHGPQITNYGTSFRVFLPKGSKGTQGK